MNEWSRQARAAGRTIGLVPTMGALHQGHLSLLAEARKRCEVSVMSIFVNPAQFGPAEDFNKYPRPLDADCAMAEAAGCGAVFVPAAHDMYPENYATYVTVEGLDGTLCGARRPGHFRGVATVVLKLFNIVCPDLAFFGQKDAQQAIILKRMAVDLNLPVSIGVCPTVRETDGLAMSSRNRYLTPAERAAAPVIYRGLRAAAALHATGEKNTARLLEAIDEQYKTMPLVKKEYAEIVDCATLEPLAVIGTAGLIAVACRTAESQTRLIDNIVIGGSL
jgi:pantoate--beta-alanine ligase